MFVRNYHAATSAFIRCGCTEEADHAGHAPSTSCHRRSLIGLETSALLDLALIPQLHVPLLDWVRSHIALAKTMDA
jgi:hypothetical protein